MFVRIFPLGVAKTFNDKKLVNFAGSFFNVVIVGLVMVNWMAGCIEFNIV